MQAPDILQQLQASKDAIKVAEILTARGVDEHTAQRLGEMVITMSDPPAWDVACWNAAQHVADLLEPRHMPLREMHARVRQLHVTTAFHAIKGFEAALTGLLNGEQLSQAYADYQNHRAQIETRVLAKRLEFVGGGAA